MRGVMAASTAAGSSTNVSGSTSAKTGVARSKSITLAEATNEMGAVMTSSPAPMPAARTQQVQAGRAARDRDGVLAAAEGRELLLEVARVGAEAEHARAQRGEHVLLLLRPDVGPRERDLARRLDVHALAGVAAG